MYYNRLTPNKTTYDPGNVPEEKEQHMRQPKTLTPYEIRLTAECDVLTGDKKRLQDQVKQLQDEHSNLLDDIYDMQDEIDGYKRDLDAMRAVMDDKLAELNQYKIAHKNDMETILNYKTEAENQRARANDLQGDNNACYEYIGCLKRQIDADTVNHREEVEELKAKIEALETMNNGLSKQLRDYKHKQMIWEDTHSKNKEKAEEWRKSLDEFTNTHYGMFIH